MRLVDADPELGMGISKLSAAQRSDDDTATFQCAWPPPGKQAPPPTVVSSGCWRPLSSPKIVASADYLPSMRTHEITSAMPIGSIGPTRGRLLGKLREAMADEEGWELANAG
jgi:hypothetical protein